MGRTKHAADSEFDTLRYVAVPQGTPEWMRAKIGSTSNERVQADLSVLLSADDFPKWMPLSAVAKEQYAFTLENEEMWREANAIYYRGSYRKHLKGSNDDLDRDILRGIPITHDGSPVWWTDLDLGPKEPATLYDLASLLAKPQPHAYTLKKKKRELWLLSLAQWDNAEFPPESKNGPPFVKGVSIAKETRARKRG